MTRRRRTQTSGAVAVIAALALVAPTGAPAAAKSPPSGARVLNSSVLAPFQVAVHRGTVYWTDGFAGTLNRRTPHGKTKVIARVDGISGFAMSGRTKAWTSAPENSWTRLTVKRPGKRAMVVNLSRYERTVNPDRNSRYGVLGKSNKCANDWLEEATGGPARYRGIVDSNPYQVEALPGGAWAIAEAAGNAILRVSKTGRISTIAVLPRQALKISKAQADALGAPDCLVGVTYAFEPVPTDVERDRRGNLWVSLLPGGPEDPSLGARGAVYKISKYGGARRVARGFLGATNLAVSRGGKVYVAELFAGRISTIRRGRVVPVRSIERPVAVEVTRRNLFVGQLADLDFETGDLNGPGGIYRFPR